MSLGLLIDDGIDGDRGLADGRAMMSSRWPRPRREQGIDDHEAGLNRLGHQIAGRWMAGAGRSIGSNASVDDRSLAVERAAERIDDAAEQRRPDRHAHDIAGAVNDIAGLDRGVTLSNSTQPTRPGSSTCAKPYCPRSKRSNSSSRTAGRPDTSAMPSPTSSTRPICSVCGPSGVAPSFARARANQASAGVSGAFCHAQGPPEFSQDRRANCWR